MDNSNQENNKTPTKNCKHCRNYLSLGKGLCLATKRPVLSALYDGESLNYAEFERSENGACNEDAKLFELTKLLVKDADLAEVYRLIREIVIKDEDYSICDALKLLCGNRNEINEDEYDAVLEDMRKHNPTQKPMRHFWFPLDAEGQRKRVEWLDKRIKDLTKIETRQAF